MTKACNIPNVIGKLLGMAEAKGVDFETSVLDDFDVDKTAAFSEVFNQSGSETYRNNPIPEVDKTYKHLTGDPLHAIHRVVNDTRNPSGILGDDVVKPVHEFISEIFDAHGNSEAGRQAYFAEINDVLDEIDGSHLNPDQQLFLERYKWFYKEGGELFGRERSDGLTKLASNVVGNIVQSSPTVIIGNVLEGVIKLPTLYPKTFLPGMAKAVEEGLFNHIPEVAAGGGYGSSVSLEKGLFGNREGWQGLIGITDVPLKNIAYFAGQLADGDGAKAVQKAAFVPRFGDLPAIYYSSGGRAGIQLLGYTVNTYKMYGQMWKDLANESTRPQALQQLVTFHALSGLIAGAGGLLPKPVEEVIKGAFPESQDWFEENKTPLAGLVQPGEINRVGVGFNILSRQGQKIFRNLEDASEGASEGDLGKVAIEAVDGALNLLPLSSGVLGDAQFQRIKDLSKKIVMDELDIEDVPEEAKERFLPFIK